MILPPYSLVELVTDRYQKRGVSVGAIGTILEIYEDEAYEIEFSPRRWNHDRLVCCPTKRGKALSRRKSSFYPFSERIRVNLGLRGRFTHQVETKHSVPNCSHR